MLYADLLETDDKSVKLAIAGLLCMKKIHLHDLREDIIEAAHNTSYDLELYTKLDGVDYEIKIKPLSTAAISVIITDVNSPSTERIHVSLNAKRILTLKTSHVVSYTSTEWLMIVCKDSIVTNTDEIIHKSELLENRFQYDTVSPLAGLILDFWGE